MQFAFFCSYIFEATSSYAAIHMLATANDKKKWRGIYDVSFICQSGE
jgi:hypothetical protein